MNDLQPRWLRDVLRLLPIRAQFVLSGNIHDLFLTSIATPTSAEGASPTNESPSTVLLAPLLRTLWQGLLANGYEMMLVFDPIDGIRVYPDIPHHRERVDKLFELKISQGNQPVSLERMTNVLKKMLGQREGRFACVIDYASRLSRSPNQLAENEHLFFVSAEKFSHSATPVAAKNQPSPLMHQPIMWLVNRAQDLPSWFAMDSEPIENVMLALPDYHLREHTATHLATLMPDYPSAATNTQKQFIQTFATQTEGLTLMAMRDIVELALHQKIPIDDIDDAIRGYKVGETENPWRKDYLRERILNAESFIEERVRGQRPAVVKALDILKRSALGLTGAHTRNIGSRPRGVLFLAGPTGVGKTELAKSITSLIFGNESAYLRFDMSEFSEEHSSARLLGAPPGYVGYDAGGELTNAVRQKPFSVVLFDEIEKAHPRILDKFLQILEDGRLTDGRGNTAYFTETILIFTSNLGIYVTDQNGERRQNVRPDDSYETVDVRVRQAIDDYFKFRLTRPEILNRIGNNIVVFHFITPNVAKDIFQGMLKNVARRLFDETGLRLAIVPEVQQQLLNYCTMDLANGGRGIGNVLETHLVNPLARTLFEHPIKSGEKLTITGMEIKDRVIEISLQFSL